MDACNLLIVYHWQKSLFNSRSYARIQPWKCNNVKSSLFLTQGPMLEFNHENATMLNLLRDLPIFVVLSGSINQPLQLRTYTIYTKRKKKKL